MNGTAQTENRVGKRSRDSKNPGLYGVAIRVRSQKRPGVFQLFLSDMVEDVTVRRWFIRQFQGRVKSLSLHQSQV